MTQFIIEETKEVFAVRNNTDGNEGRGREYNQFFCEYQSTAIRLGKGRYVQGQDAPIQIINAFKIDGVWLYPALLSLASAEDIIVHNEAIKAQQVADEKASIMNRMIEAGFTEAEINKLIK